MSRIETLSLIAHRGFPASFTENTIESVRLALEHSPDWIEVDVQRSADGVLFLFHDQNLSRLGVESGISPAEREKPIGAWKWEEIERLSLGFEVPTFQQFVEFMKLRAPTVGLCIELKQPHLYPGVEMEVLELLKRNSIPAQNVLIQSFDPSSLAIVRKCDRKVTLGLLTDGSRGIFCDLKDAKKFRCAYLNRSGKCAWPWNMFLARIAGLKTWIYTLNKDWHWSLARILGADGIITDEIARAQNWRKRVSS